MKNKAVKRMLALVLASAMTLTACSQTPDDKTTEAKQSTENVDATGATPAETESEPKEPVSITMYPLNAKLFSGEVTGFRGDVLAEHGIELEVWAYSDEKTNGMLTTGNFPDMMYIAPGKGDILETLIETDKIINYDDYAEYLPHILGDEVVNEWITPNLDLCRESYSAGTGGLYVLPFGVGYNSGYYAQVSTFDRYTPKLKWDVYEAIGAPEVTDMWSLIDIVEDMLEYQPTAPDGTKMYGTYLDNSDSKYFNSLTLWMYWKGSNVADTQYMSERNVLTGDVNYIFEDNSVFKEGLKWYNEMYRRGLIDPDSISTARTDQAPKLDNAYAMLPAGSLPGYSPNYYEVFPTDSTIQRSFCTETYKGNETIVIFKDSENIEACLEFIDMLADPYEYMKFYYGPEGCMWQEEGNVLSITDKFAAWLEEKGAVNNFPMPDGTEFAIWNATGIAGAGTALKDHVDINGNALPYDPTKWPDAQAITTVNDNWTAWKKTMNANDLWDYVNKNDINVVQKSPFDGVVAPKANDSQNLTIAALKDTVVTACWKMVYAESEADFDKIWDQMVKDAEIQGAKEIHAWYKDAFKPNK